MREYANAEGTVFAVSWNGPFLPAAFAARLDRGAGAAAAGAGRASAVSIQNPDLTLLSGGRMGAFRGRAWLPRQLPAGLDPRSLP